jgi:hypothetical protein
MVVDFFLVLFYYPETASISLERMQVHLVVDELVKGNHETIRSHFGFGGSPCISGLRANFWLA